MKKNQWNHIIKNTCDDLDFIKIEIEVIPFERSVVGGTPAMLDVIEKANWKPDYFPIVDEKTSLDLLGEDYLNHDMQLLDIDEVVEYVKEKNMDFFFAKPNTDLKLFDGTVFDIERYPFFYRAGQ